MNSPKQRPSGSSLIGPIFIVLMGGISLVAGLKSGAESWAFTSRAIRTQGTVVRLEKGKGPDANQNARCPVVTYHVDGKSYEVFGPVRAQPNTTGWPKVPAIDSSVTVLYDPDRPEEALVESFEQQLGEGVLFSALGFTFLLLGIILLWRRRNSQVGTRSRA